MKTKIALLSMLTLLCFSFRSSAQVDLVPGINYSYNPPGANGIIQIVNMDVCNNGPSAAGSFDVALYIYNTTTNKVYVVGDTTLSGINGNACITIYSWNVNINKTPGIPAGTYEVGEWVNSQQMVTESDTTNNAGLFSGSWSYTPTGIDEVKAEAGTISVYPNPGNGTFYISRVGGTSKLTAEIYNLLGEKITSTSLDPSEGGRSTTTLSLPNGSASGVYFYKVFTEKGEFVTSGKLVNN